MQPDHFNFLSTIDQIATPYECIRMKDKIDSLSLPFWSYQEIQDGLSIREDWNIAENLVPFFGDWHDIYCLDVTTSQIVYLDDSRNTVFIWPDTQNFIGCLTNEPATEESDAPEPTLISFHLSDEFRRKAESILKRNKA